MTDALMELESLLQPEMKKQKKVVKETKVELRKSSRVLMTVNLEKLLASALACGHSIQQLACIADNQLSISCKACGRKVDVEEEEEEVSLEEASGGGGAPPTPRVLLTGYRSAEHLSTLSSLGALAATSPSACELVVADSLRATPTLVEAVVRGVAVVSPAWVVACQAAGRLLPPGPHLLRDQHQEEVWGVHLPSSLARARRGGVLAGRRVHLDLGGEEVQYTRLVEAAGGEVVGEGGRGEGVLVVQELSRREGEGGRCRREAEVKRLKKEGAKVVSRKWLLQALLRQKLGEKSV